MEGKGQEVQEVQEGQEGQEGQEARKEWKLRSDGVAKSVSTLECACYFPVSCSSYS